MVSISSYTVLGTVSRAIHSDPFLARLARGLEAQETQPALHVPGPTPMSASGELRGILGAAGLLEGI